MLDGNEPIPVQDLQNITETKQTVNPYNRIEDLGRWIMGGLNVGEANQAMESPYENMQKVVDQVSCCLPIEGGEGNGSIYEQLEFWRANQDLFTKFHDRRQSAADLVDSRQAIIEKKNENVALLEDIQFKKFMRGKKSQYSEEEVRAMQKLNDAIRRRKESLNKTETQFNEDRELQKSISSRIDCKLPAVSTGFILKELGWNVSLSSFNYPEHPFLIASKTDIKGETEMYSIGFNSTPSVFKSDPTVTKINNLHLEASRNLSIRNGFISINDTWPLPFNEDTFQRFDNWYINNVRNKKK